MVPGAHVVQARSVVGDAGVLAYWPTTHGSEKFVHTRFDTKVGAVDSNCVPLTQVVRFRHTRSDVAVNA